MRQVYGTLIEVYEDQCDPETLLTSWSSRFTLIRHGRRVVEGLATQESDIPIIMAELASVLPPICFLESRKSFRGQSRSPQVVKWDHGKICRENE